MSARSLRGPRCAREGCPDLGKTVNHAAHCFAELSLTAS